MVFLNGCFQITVHEARNLPKTDNMGFSAGDPYLILKDCRGATLLRTKTINKSTNPRWDETKIVSIVECSKLELLVYDADVTVDEMMCQGTIGGDSPMFATARGGQTARGWVPLKKGEVMLTIAPCYHVQKGKLDVHNTRFQAHPGGRVTLYQSAHIGGERDYLPRLTFMNGQQKTQGWKRMHQQCHQPWQSDDNADGARAYEPRNCWEELYVSILEAKLCIYIVGWSVNVEIPLLRERNVVVPGYNTLDGTQTSLGEILEMKSREGVKVCIMIWREATSNTMIGFDGVAGTYSEQTKNFFTSRNSGVVVKSLLRLNESSLHLVAFTHHQKYVVCDAPALTQSAAPRRIIAYMGGIDVTKGRFETPRKHLFGKNATWYKDDFYQNCVAGADQTKDCRQPWQDIHAKVEGTIARDLITNFEERWNKQTNSSDALFRLQDMVNNRQILAAEEDVVYDVNHPEAWNVQLFRSIDHHSSNAVSGVEGGIHNAYEHAINKAERFLYFENQYFMGGSKEWSKEVSASKRANWLHKVQSALSGGDEVQAVNRIPLLIVQRICRAIKERKNFACYVCIPMFPEGLPEAAPMQEIIYWQFRTMEMMYRMISDCLREEGVNRKATEYLNFFCLGNREPGPNLVGEGKTRRHLVARARRHMIYVHSKMLIADDDYIIVGSANINDRSMAGDRDTEIAFGAYQPHQSRDKGVSFSNGGIQAFRLSLWGEHLNEGAKVNDALFYPECVECVDYINQKAGLAWRQHASELQQEQCCHLMKWPIVMKDDGSVFPLAPEFPDAPAAKVSGTESQSIPDFMTS